jgi:dihydroorotase-like cyclic amidohydrolase
MFPLFGFAQDILKDFEQILIRNVTVIDQDGESEDVVVSILIEQKILEMVSQDKISLEEADITFDAKGGFILG